MISVFIWSDRSFIQKKTSLLSFCTQGPKKRLHYSSFGILFDGFVSRCWSDGSRELLDKHCCNNEESSSLQAKKNYLETPLGSSNECVNGKVESKINSHLYFSFFLPFLVVDVVPAPKPIFHLGVGARYHSCYIDVKNAGYNAWYHFDKWGRGEGRKWCGKLVWSLFLLLIWSSVSLLITHQ